MAGEARRYAINRLIGAHREEWEQLLGDERAARGLKRVPGSNGPGRAELLQRIADLEAELERQRKERS